MSDVGNTLTITASLIGADQVVLGTAKMSAAVTGARTAIDGASASTVKGTKALSEHDLAHKNLGKTLSDTNTKLISLSDSLGTKVFSATRKAAQGIAGLTAGVLAMGAATAAQFQSTTLDIQSFTGDTAKQASGVTKSLYAMSNPVGMKNVTANYEHLMTAGFGQEKSLQLMRSITDISATKQDPAGTEALLSETLMKVADTGKIDPRTVRSLGSAGVNLTDMLGKEMGMSRFAVMQWLKQTNGAPRMVPHFTEDSETLNGPGLEHFKGGREAYAKTFSGSVKEFRKNMSEGIAFSVFGAGKDDGTGPDGNGGVMGLLGPKIYGASQQVGPAIAKIAPDVIRFATALGTQLPGLGRALEHLWDAAQPLAPVVERVIGAVIPLTTTLVSTAARLLEWGRPLIGLAGDIAGFVATSGPARQVIVDMLGALLLYKTVSGAVEWVRSMRKTMDNLFKLGKSTPLEIAGTTMQTAADTMVTAANLMVTAGTEEEVAATEMVTAGGAAGIARFGPPGSSGVAGGGGAAVAGAGAGAGAALTGAEVGAGGAAVAAAGRFAGAGAMAKGFLPLGVPLAGAAVLGHQASDAKAKHDPVYARKVETLHKLDPGPGGLAKDAWKAFGKPNADPSFASYNFGDAYTDLFGGGHGKKKPKDPAGDRATQPKLAGLEAGATNITLHSNITFTGDHPNANAVAGAVSKVFRDQMEALSANQTARGSGRGR